jgi:hypothetical protein
VSELQEEIAVLVDGHTNQRLRQGRRRGGFACLQHHQPVLGRDEHLLTVALEADEAIGGRRRHAADDLHRQPRVEPGEDPATARDGGLRRLRRKRKGERESAIEGKRSHTSTIEDVPTHR